MTVLAHGVGARHDLPLPLDLVLQGAAVALLASFLALGLLWTKPRFDAAEPRPDRDRWPVRLLVAAGLVLVPAPAWPHLVFVRSTVNSSTAGFPLSALAITSMPCTCTSTGSSLVTVSSTVCPRTASTRCGDAWSTDSESTSGSTAGGAASVPAPDEQPASTSSASSRA